jgi:tight adherence protein C
MWNNILIIAIWVTAVTVLYFLFTRGRQSRLVRQRIFASPRADVEARQSDVADAFLAGWLSRAGFRAPGSPGAFILATVLCTVIGAVLALVIQYSGLIEALTRSALNVSEGMASLLESVLIFLPWGVFLGLALGPWLFVRSRRKRRVMIIERELPLILELFATLSEAGLGFDASFSKIMENEDEDSPLATELRTFQMETLAGVPRLRCFRRLSRRCEVGSMTIFCSAMIQAEQVGAGFSSVLRLQADDLRSRRREQAMIKAQALPVKLVFPLVICFLPGIFIATLGPAFHEMFRMVEGVIRQ